MVTKQFIESEVKRLGEIQPWWHDFELPQGIRTIDRSRNELRLNHNAVKWHKLRSLIDFRGKSVVDLGCNEGFYCQEAVRLGAAHVVGVDIDAHRIEKATFAANVLGMEEIQFVQASAYDVTQQTLSGRCDLALVLGLLHRVSDPYQLILKASELADTVVFEWAALSSHQPVMQFWGGGTKDYDHHNTGYWKISRRCVLEILARTRAGHYSHIEPKEKRAILAATCCPTTAAIHCAWRPLASAIPTAEESSRRSRIAIPRWFKKVS